MGGVPNRHEIGREEQAAFSLNGYALNMARKKVKQLIGMIMTMPGVPCLFYGDELGVQGYGDPFCRSTFPWDSMDEVDPGAEMRNWVKALTCLRKSSKAFSTGEFNYVYRIGYTYAYIREYEDEKYIVLVNFDSTYKDIRLDAAKYGVTGLKAMLSTDSANSEYESCDGVFFIKTPPQSLVIFKEV